MRKGSKLFGIQASFGYRLPEDRFENAFDFPLLQELSLVGRYIAISLQVRL